MERRTLMLTLSGAALPLLVQAAPRFALAQPTGAATPSTPMDMAQYRLLTLTVGSLAKQTSELALERALHPQVKQFAGFENAEQTTLAQVLTDMQNPPPPPLDANGQAILRQLQATSGPGFDQAYIQAQIQAHQQLFGIQNAVLQGQTGMTTDTAHVAMLARYVIQTHLVMLQDIARILHT
ncbi:MAG: DUF4142 domain-containing protein [Acetobacteraceae bacterium]|nr:DUF4142 domain-containing protein [Acetobacteraceae bacterium]